MRSIHKAIQRLCAILIGVVFFASGIVKIIDPVGVSLIFEEYFKFMHLSWLSGASYVFGVALPLIETLVGAVLIAGVWKRIAASVSALMTLGFLGISIALVVLNPAMDCGCFGEAIHLTHSQTLIKNIILAALWCVAFLPFPWKEKAPKGKVIGLAIVTLLTVFVSVRSIIDIPMVDFTAFAPGEEIFAKRQGNGDNPVLGLRDISGEYCDSLACEERVMVLSVYRPEEVNAQEWQDIASWTLECMMEEYTPLVVVSGTPESMQSTLDALGQENAFLLESSLYFSDFKTLITLNRSNGGVSYLSDGMIVQKWSASHRPDQAKLHSLAGFDPVEEMLRTNTHGRVTFESIAGLSIAILLLL